MFTTRISHFLRNIKQILFLQAKLICGCFFVVPWDTDYETEPISLLITYRVKYENNGSISETLRGCRYLPWILTSAVPVSCSLGPGFQRRLSQTKFFENRFTLNISRLRKVQLNVYLKSLTLCQTFCELSSFLYNLNWLSNLQWVCLVYESME